MSDSSNSTVMALDGGGTRCRIALGSGDTVTQVEVGPANVSTDFEGAVREIMNGLDQLANAVDSTTQDLLAVPTFVGLAGVTGADIAGRLRDALPLSRLWITDDRPASLRGALGHSDGAIAHCGTGSFFAAQQHGQMKFSGGWGPVLGDEASAHTVGRSALRLTLEHVDGQRAPSQLSELFLSDFGGSAGIVEFAGQASPSEFGALAPKVTEHANRGDTLARDVMALGAEEIVRELTAIGWKKGMAICLTGGIGPQFESYLPEFMRANLTAPTSEPLAGALELAAEFAQGTLE